jgi:hypothetical protein
LRARTQIPWGSVLPPVASGVGADVLVHPLRASAPATAAMTMPRRALRGDMCSCFLA